MVSGTTGSPRAAKRAGSPLALIEHARDLRREPFQQPLEHAAAADVAHPLVAAPHPPANPPASTTPSVGQG